MNDTITIHLSKRSKEIAGKYTAIVDTIDADLDLLNWTFSKSKYTFYAVRRPGARNARLEIKMHRVIMSRMLDGRELLSTEQVDHIDGNGWNNTRSNLRLATNGQNQHNQRIPSDNTSGYKGVTWHKREGKWRAQIRVDNKQKWIGSFSTPELAHEAYCKAAKEYFGEYANEGQYGIPQDTKTNRLLP